MVTVSGAYDFVSQNSCLWKHLAGNHATESVSNYSWGNRRRIHIIVCHRGCSTSDRESRCARCLCLWICESLRSWLLVGCHCLLADIGSMGVPRTLIKVDPARLGVPDCWNRARRCSRSGRLSDLPLCPTEGLSTKKGSSAEAELPIFVRSIQGLSTRLVCEFAGEVCFTGVAVQVVFDCAFGGDAVGLTFELCDQTEVFHVQRE